MPYYPPASGGGGTPGGSDTQIQFNNEGSFGGSADLTFVSSGSDFIYKYLTLKSDAGEGYLIVQGADPVDHREEPTVFVAAGGGSGANIWMAATGSGYTDPNLLNLSNSATIYAGSETTGGVALISRGGPLRLATGGFGFANEWLKISTTGVFQLGSFSTVTGSGDLGFTRNAAGVLEINNGTAGTLRDLTLRHLTASGTTSFGGFALALAGNFATSGANALTLTTTGSTNVTLPTSGTLLSSIAPLVLTDANTVSQYNSTTAQTLNVFNTRTDASNYEAGSMRWVSNALHIGTFKAGTGSTRNIHLMVGGSAACVIGAGGISPQVPLTVGNNAFSGASATTAARTADGTEDTSFVFVSNRGASGTVTRALLTYITPIWMTRIASQAFRIQPSSGKSFLRADGTVTTADRYLSLDSDGASVMIVYDGTNYVCLAERGTISVQA